MNYLKNYFFIFIILIFLSSCGGFQNFKKTMTGQKQVTTDEFLIKKKDPLVLPPEYEKLPLPNTKEENKKSAIETVLNSSKKESDSKSTSVLENMILKELRNKR